ncbi:MAG TPA: dihydroorotase [Gammaproteobacteria bacterium]|nr:dihydroorotase [Gammaproteobacteria bacterium]
MRLTLARPDDFHLHLRDGAALADLVPPVARRFARALVMPNLDPAVTTVAAAAAYRERIRAAIPRDCDFHALMTLYLTEATPAAEIERAATSGFVHAAKLYPAGATTGSAAGVRDVAAIFPLLERMSEAGLVLAIHGELADPALDPYEREPRFVAEVLAPLVGRFPELRIVLEHLSTRAAVEFVAAAGPNVAATITAHHLLCSRTEMFAQGLSPHHFCRPVLQSEADREALLAAATSGNPKFFLGSDSAPHPRANKESARAAAGVYTGYAALELYAEAFAAAGALERLENFASRFGAGFYRLPANSGSVVLEETSWQAPGELPLGAATVVPLGAGERLRFRLAE